MIDMLKTAKNWTTNISFNNDVTALEMKTKSEIHIDYDRYDEFSHNAFESYYLVVPENRKEIIRELLKLPSSLKHILGIDEKTLLGNLKLGMLSKCKRFKCVILFITLKL